MLIHALAAVWHVLTAVDADLVAYCLGLVPMGAVRFRA